MASILSNPELNRPVDDQMRAMQQKMQDQLDEYKRERERQRRETITYDVIAGRTGRTSPTPRFNLPYLRDYGSPDFYGGNHTCPRCGQDTRYVQFCSPRVMSDSREEQAHRLNFDPDTVVDGEVVDEVLELDRAPDVD